MGQPFPPPTTAPLYVAALPNPRAPLPRLEGRARHVVIVELAVMGGMLALPSLVFGLQGLGRARQIDTEITYLELVARMLSALGPAALCVFLLWRDGVLGRSMFARRSVGFTTGWGALTFVCIFGAAIVGGLLIAIIQESLGSDAARNVRGDTDLTIRYFLVAIGFSITAGISEEAIWRGYGTARVEQAGYPRAALFAPSIIWVLLHVYGGPYTLLGVAFIGAPIVWMAWWKRSVWPLMLAHTAWDVFAFLIATVDQPEAILQIARRS